MTTHVTPPPSGQGILWVRNSLDGGIIMIPPGLHTFIAGRTGAGKSRLIGQILINLLPDILSGTAMMYGIDLKDGVELGPWRHWMRGMADEPDKVAPLIGEIDEIRRERNQTLREQGRTKVDIGPDLPLIVLVIDEMAELAGAVGREDKARQEQCQRLLDRILRLGRSAGITVIGASQDPRKEATPLRDRFPNRVALALNSRAETVMMMGEDAVRDGCAPHTIPTDLPGTGYWHDSLHRRAVRFRTIDSLGLEGFE